MKSALLVALLLSACMSNAPKVTPPNVRLDPGASTLLERGAWHTDPRAGDRYAVAGLDQVFADRLAIGPKDDASGACVMRPDGDVEVRAPWTTGHWSCLLRVCRDGCMIARLTVIAEPKAEP